MCGGQLREEQSEHQKIEIFLWVVCLFVCFSLSTKKDQMPSVTSQFG